MRREKGMGAISAREAERDEALLLGEDDEDSQVDKYLSFRIGEESSSASSSR